MTPQKQLFMHDPDNGVWGDCFRTALACLLDRRPESVPHFNDRTDGRDSYKVAELVSEWVRAEGLHLISIQFEGSVPIDMVLASAQVACTGLPFLLSGQSSIGADHVVVCEGGKIVWDPSRIDSGIVGPMSNGMWLIEWLVAAPATTPTPEMLNLTRTEAKLYAVLLDRQPHTREELEKKGLEKRACSPNLVSQHVYRFRQKLLAHGLDVVSTRSKHGICGSYQLVQAAEAVQ